MRPVDLAKRLKDFVTEHGTQKEAAEELGISQSYLSDLIRHARQPGPDILRKLGLRKTVVYVEDERAARS